MAMSRRYNHAMSPSFAPLKLLLMMFAGWVSRHQLDVIEYLPEENRVLKERLGGRRLRFTDAERRRLARKAQALDVIRLPPRSPNLNAFAERFVRSIKEECLNRMIFFGQASLRRAIAQYVSHYHCERNHQGLGNRLLQPIADIHELHHPVRRRERLGGILSYYHRQAA
jgi:transposase InsO family protein